MYSKFQFFIVFEISFGKSSPHFKVITQNDEILIFVLDRLQVARPRLE